MNTALLEEVPLFWVSRCHEEEKSTTGTVRLDRTALSAVCEQLSQCDRGFSSAVAEDVAVASLAQALHVIAATAKDQEGPSDH